MVGYLFALSHAFLLRLCPCVSPFVWLLLLIWKQLSPLSSAGCNPNQTKALTLSPSLPSVTPNQDCPVFQSFLSIQLCNSVISFFFHFTCHSFYSSPFWKLLSPTWFSSFFSVLKPVYIRLICLWQMNAPLLLWESWRSTKYVERI